MGSDGFWWFLLGSWDSDGFCLFPISSYGVLIFTIGHPAPLLLRPSSSCSFLLPPSATRFYKLSLIKLSLTKLHLGKLSLTKLSLAKLCLRELWLTKLYLTKLSLTKLSPSLSSSLLPPASLSASLPASPSASRPASLSLPFSLSPCLSPASY